MEFGFLRGLAGFYWAFLRLGTHYHKVENKNPLSIGVSMIKQLFFVITIFMVVIFSSSCSSLISKNYVGEKVSFSDENRIDEDTVWVFDKTTYYVHVVNSNSLVAASVEWDEKAKKHIIKSNDVFITKLKDYFFIQIKEKDEEYYTILRFLPSNGREFVLLTIDSKKIKKDIEAGKVKVKKTSYDTYTFEGSKKELDEYILKNINSVFDYNSPGVIRLISGELK